MARRSKYIFVPLMIILSLLTTRCALDGVTAQSFGANEDKSTPATTEQRQTDGTGLSAEQDQTDFTQPTTQTKSITQAVSIIINQEGEQVPVTPSVSSEFGPSDEGPGEVPGRAPVYGEPLEMEEDEIVAEELEEVDLATWQVYTDEVYGYRISHPPYFEIAELDEAQLAALSPAPVGATLFRDQGSELADIAPPDFSITVFENTTGQPLEEWLVTRGLLNREAGWFTEPWSGTHESGLSVFSQKFMAPGWFVYVVENTHVFQLTPLGVEAQTMLDTFDIQR